jgi:hypothetical protein
MTDNLPELGDLEREVMQLVWADGPITVQRKHGARRGQSARFRRDIEACFGWALRMSGFNAKRSRRSYNAASSLKT